MSKLYEDFLRTLDEEIEKSSPEHREQIKILFLQAWYNTFPDNSIAQFTKKFKHIRTFSRAIKYEASKILGRTFKQIKMGVRV
ncbi:hypothetical protein [Thermosipho globiformans]|uniref:hypothetical protein n=1 Tax=Thermosipho globiformans TaxID=380685 RepID=UPI000F8C8EA5|nr:hypothetical protein [Thermosipho globiformans]